jgi:hypothetical protein
LFHPLQLGVDDTKTFVQILLTVHERGHTRLQKDERRVYVLSVRIGGVLLPNDARVGVGRATETHAPLQHHVFHLLGEVHVEQAGVKATAIELIYTGKGILFGHHVDKAIAVHDDDINDGAQAGK